MEYVVSLLKHMKSPSFICVCRTERTRDQLMLELARGTNLLFWLGIAATTVSAGVLGYAIAKYVQICIPIQLLFDTLISYTFSKLFLLSSKMT